MKGAIIFAGALLLAAGAGVEPPRIGCMIDSAGRARAVYGVAGTFILAGKGVDCAVEAQPGDRYWTARREQERWWLIQLDRESSGEIERVPLDEKVEFAVAFGGTAITSSGKIVEYRGRQWEFTTAVEGLHRMSESWVQVATAGGSYAIQPEEEHQPYLLPQGDRE